MLESMSIAGLDGQSLVSTIGRLIGLLSTGAPPVDDPRGAVAHWAAGKLSEATAALQNTLAESAIDRSISAVTAEVTEKPLTGGDEVVAGLQKRLAAAVREVDALTESLKAEKARADIAEATRNNAWELVESAEADLTSTRNALALTRKVAEASQAPVAPAKVQTDIAGVVEVVLEAAPELVKFKSVLAEQKSVDGILSAVRELSTITPAPIVRAPVVEAEAPVVRRAACHVLPSPLVEGVQALDRSDTQVLLESVPANHPARHAARAVKSAIVRV
jgi:hypothetical protein